MPTETYNSTDNPGTTVFDPAGKTDITFEIYSMGGRGSSGVAGSACGGGGGAYVAGAIPNADVAGDTLSIGMPDPISDPTGSTQITLTAGALGISVMPGSE